VAIELEDGFYGGGGQVVLERLRRLPSNVETALLVGHEPVWSATVGGLCGGADVRFPTAALACLTRDSAGWQDLTWGSMQLQWLLTPKLLKQSGLGGSARP
jgi:phosphohistidine phosphatase